MSSKLSRRHVLRGLGVGLSLPWLESLSPKLVRAQATSTAKRYLLMYFPCGVARAFWRPEGEGDAWSLSALLEPLAAHKQNLQVVEGIGQEELYNAGLNPNPSHSLYAAPAFSCTVPDTREPILGGPTVDQIIAQHIGGAMPFSSLQTGCSTMNSSSDGRHPSITRSMSWAASDQPLYKEVNPQAVFDNLVTQLAPGGGGNPDNQALAELRKARDLSALDYVIDEATSLSGKVSAGDRRRLDQFLTSVRELEGRTRTLGSTIGVTKTYTRPTLSASYEERRGGAAVDPNDPEGYNRDVHAEAMNDLITMAFETDLTRVITHMLDDARSDYHYGFLNERRFENGTSTEIDMQLETVLSGAAFLGYHGLSHDGDNNDGFATVNYWFVQKLASLLDRLSAAVEPDGSEGSVLDNTIVFFMSGIQGSSHQLVKLPVVLAGGKGILKNDYYNDFPSQVRLADVLLTFMQAGFGMDVDRIGYSQGIVPELLA